MNKFRIWLFMTAFLAGCQTMIEPDTIVYVPATEGINERAVASIMLCLNQPDCEILLGEKLDCGPFLWRELREHPALANIGEPTQYTIQETSEDGTQREVVLEGRRFEGWKQVRAFWQAMLEAFPAETHERIRSLTDEECRIYWTLIRGKIQEPVFMIYGKDSKLLMQLTGVRHRLTLMFLDDFQTVALRE